MSFNANIYAFSLPVQPDTYSVTITFHKVLGGIELDFTPVCKIRNGGWTEKYPSEIYYTLDGSSPKNGILYDERRVSLSKAKTYTIRVIAIDEDSVWSRESNTTYTVEQLSEPEITNVQADGETYVNISSPEGATIYYTTDLSTPTAKSTQYTGEITLTDDTKIKAVAVKEGYVTSDVAQEYITVETFLKFTCAECGNELSNDGLYNADGKAICRSCYEQDEVEFTEDLYVYISYETDGYEADVTMTASKKDATIYYTLDGTEPTVTSDIYYDKIRLCEDTTVKAFAQYRNIVTETVEIFIPFEEKSNYIECPHCEKKFEDNEDIYDEDGYAVCPYCDEYIDYDENDEYEDINEIECPHCNNIFEETGDVYDEYGYIICPYCDGYILQEIEYDEEMEFITSDWAKDEVYKAYQNNLIPDEMIEDTLYDTITRAEFAAVAVKLYEKIMGEYPLDVDIEDTPFTDCNYTTYYSNYIAIAYMLGITDGITDTTFSPYDNITREQLATMLYRVIKIAENEKTYGFDVNNVRKFYDDSEISDYAKESVYFMAEYGIVKGTDGACFAPLDTATKEQSILMSVRCINSLYK